MKNLQRVVIPALYVLFRKTVFETPAHTHMHGSGVALDHCRLEAEDALHRAAHVHIQL